MVPRGVQTPGQFYRGCDRVAHRDLALLHGPPLNDQSRHRALGVFHRDDAIGAADGAPVAQLSATLCIERRLADDNFYLLAPSGMVHRDSAQQDSGDLGVLLREVITDEFVGANTQLGVGNLHIHAPGERARGPGLLFLSVHLSLETRHVHFQPVFFGDLSS